MKKKRNIMTSRSFDANDSKPTFSHDLSLIGA